MAGGFASPRTGDGATRGHQPACARQPTTIPAPGEPSPRRGGGGGPPRDRPLPTASGQLFDLSLVTAANASTCPWPYQEVWPPLPAHSCGAPLCEPTISEYGVPLREPAFAFGSACGQACGSAVWLTICSTWVGRIVPFCGFFRSPYRLITSAASPATCGPAIEVPWSRQ